MNQDSDKWHNKEIKRVFYKNIVFSGENKIGLKPGEGLDTQTVGWSQRQLTESQRQLIEANANWLESMSNDLYKIEKLGYRSKHQASSWLNSWI